MLAYFHICLILFFILPSLCYGLISHFSTSLLHSSDLDDPEGLAYDWVNQRLYFTDYYRGDVQSIGLNGQNRSLIANAYRPRGIIVDPCYGYKPQMFNTIY